VKTVSILIYIKKLSPIHTVSVPKNYQFHDVIMHEPLVVKTMIKCRKSHSPEINSMGDVIILLSCVLLMSMLGITGANI